MMLYFYHNRFTFTAAEFFVIDLMVLFPVSRLIHYTIIEIILLIFIVSDCFLGSNIYNFNNQLNPTITQKFYQKIFII